MNSLLVDFTQLRLNTLITRTRTLKQNIYTVLGQRSWGQPRVKGRGHGRNKEFTTGGADPLLGGEAQFTQHRLFKKS